MTKVIARIFGGLGNQLFCYAAARRLAIANDAELVIDDVTGFLRDHAYRRKYQLDHFNIPCRKATAAERLEPFSRIRRYLRRAYDRRRPFQERHYVQQEGIDFDSRLLDLRPRDPIWLEGYWQSEDYFKDVETTIREDLHIRPPTDAANLEMAGYIRSCLAVGVHMRFFDRPNEHGINNVPGDYYARAIAKMETLEPGAHYFLFSDRPSSARARAQLSEPRVTCVSHNAGDANAYADLWLMTQCQHFIIANSTFSWWAAWLARRPGKHVIAPGFEVVGDRRITSWGFKGLLPKTWIRV